ncbi:MAG: choice-of-anchor D domain-containing protein [Candidatus Omnitrophota bacterium]|nr:choice-of-anchor D domain-containing protein [Candidatus Omnitrophota bacterium]
MRRTRTALLSVLLLAGCNLVPTPATLDFGTLYAGTSSGPLAAHWVNNGDKNAQLIALSTKLPYEIANAATFSNPQDIPPNGSSQQVQVRFSPTTPGTFLEEVRPVFTGVNGQYLALTGTAVWRKDEGAFSLENRLPNIVGSFDFSSYPIQPNQPIDWGIKALGAPPTEAIFQIKNTGLGINGTAVARLINGNKHFTITFPQAHNGFNIGGGGGTREIRVSFDPAELGDWTDAIEITDSANPANKTGIAFKVRVAEGA